MFAAARTNLPRQLLRRFPDGAVRLPDRRRAAALRPQPAQRVVGQYMVPALEQRDSGVARHPAEQHRIALQYFIAN